MKKNVLLAIEAMSEVDQMAEAAEKHGYQLRILAQEPSYYGKTTSEVVEFPTRNYDRLVEYVQEHRDSIAQVFSVTDTWGVEASELRDHFGFYQFGDTEKLRFFRDKRLVENKLVERNFVEVSSSWPKIMKLRNGTGKIGVHLVSSPFEVKALGKNSSEYMFQDYYFGPTYSAEVWRDSEYEIFLGVTNRIVSPPPLFTEKVKSFPWAANTPWETRVKDWTLKLLRELDYDLGLAHVEFIETSDGLRLVEINARMAGALITPGVLKTTNFNPYEMVVNQALGLPITHSMSREIYGGYSHVSIYAESTGIFQGVAGIKDLGRYPGEVSWLGSRHVGERIAEIGTYRSRFGNIVAVGPTAEIAQDRALSSSQAVVVEISAG